MDVSIIIVNYNTCKITSDCINSIIDMTEDVSYEIIVVDNASQDESKQVFENDIRIRYVY
jgi:GT2 family glycosyltransferase